VALATRLAEAYEETYPWVTVHLETYNSLLSEQALRQDEADVALLSWSKQDTETILWTRPVFKDGLVVIAHPATPFTEMNLDLLQEIYRGRIQEWGDSVLVVVTREDGSGTRAAFDSAILQGRDITLTAVVMISNDAVIQYVADTPGSIGYISTLQTSSDTSGVKMLPLEGILPTRATIQEGSYALVRELHLATVGEPTGEAREFAQWVLGPKGQAIINDLSD
jgi:phosphate transport system substrate-binding protein